MSIEQDRGWLKLAYAVIEQAVMDVKVLQRRGVLQNGGIVNWPKRRGKYVHINGYANPRAAQTLLYFFRHDSLARMLAQIGAPINIDAMLSRLHL